MLNYYLTAGVTLFASGNGIAGKGRGKMDQAILDRLNALSMTQPIAQEIGEMIRDELPKIREVAQIPERVIEKMANDCEYWLRQQKDITWPHIVGSLPEIARIYSEYEAGDAVCQINRVQIIPNHFRYCPKPPGT